MKLISFDPIRTLHFPPHTTLKADAIHLHQQRIKEADWVLFPPYWLINQLVFGLGARIFPSLPSYLIGHNKVEMTRVFELLAPNNTPLTLIRANTPENSEDIWAQLDTPFVAKLIKSSMGEGVFLIESKAQWREYCAQAAVLYAQELLPIDRDLRIVWIGNEVVGGYWRVQSPYSFHNNIARGGEIIHGPMPEKAVQLVTSIAQALAIDHAGFDIAMVGDHPYILEFNRLFGGQGLRQDQQQITQLIVNYLHKKSEMDDPTEPEKPVGNGVARRKVRRRRAA